MSSSGKHCNLLLLVYLILLISLSVTESVAFGKNASTVSDAPLMPVAETTEDELLSELLKSQSEDTFPANSTDGDNEDLAKRIINGLDAPDDDFRYAASIKGVYPHTKATTYCGASFISNQWLLTAAHCFNGKTATGDTMKNPKYWHVQAGNVYIELGPTDSSNQVFFGHKGPKERPNRQKGTMTFLKLLDALINGGTLLPFMSPHSGKHGKVLHAHPDRIIIHPKYKTTDLEWDIALMHIPHSINAGKRPNVDLINLPEPRHLRTMPQPGIMCNIVGWGCLKKGGKPSKRAQLGRLKVVKQADCRKMYHNNAGLNQKHEFCAGFYKGSLGICPGDSGSGLVCKDGNKWYIAGVASATHSKLPSRYPGLFTRVAYFREWIDSVTKNGE